MYLYSNIQTTDIHWILKDLKINIATVVLVSKYPLQPKETAIRKNWFCNIYLRFRSCTIGPCCRSQSSSPLPSDRRIVRRISDRHSYRLRVLCYVRRTPAGYLHDRLSCAARVNRPCRYYYCWRPNCRPYDILRYHWCRYRNRNRNDAKYFSPKLNTIGGKSELYKQT